MHLSEVYLEPCQTIKMELFAKIPWKSHFLNKVVGLTRTTLLKEKL